MKFKRSFAAGVIGLAMFGGATACGSTDPHAGQVQEVEYGYYNASHVFVYYPAPRTVYVTKQYYTSHGSLFANPAHHTTTTRTTTTVHTHPITGKKTTTTKRTTTTTRHR